MIKYYKRNHGKTIELGDIIKVGKEYKFEWYMMIFKGEEEENFIDLTNIGTEYGTFFSKLEFMRMKNIDKLSADEKGLVFQTIFHGKRI